MSASSLDPALDRSMSFVSRIFPVLLLLALLAFPQLSILGAGRGLLLWFNVVLPTLAPFMICTQAVVALGGVELLTRPFYPVFHRVFHSSLQGTYVMLCGLLCGYPLGARMCAEFRKEGRISGREANYLLAICNHPSPMFLLGFVHTQLGGQVPAWQLLLCLYLPILPVSMLAGRLYHITSEEDSSCAAAAGTRIRSSNTKQIHTISAAASSRSLDAILYSTADTMVLIGGYIMLFSILAVWICQLRMLPLPLRSLLTGIAEITTGVNQICASLPADQQFLPVVAVVAFGGLSGIFQTRSVLKAADTAFGSQTKAITTAGSSELSCETKKNPEKRDSDSNAVCTAGGLSIRHYTGWKALHALLSSLMALVMIYCCS